jgi:hypothetical protein
MGKPAPVDTILYHTKTSIKPVLFGITICLHELMKLIFYLKATKNLKLHGFSPQANYTDRATVS